MQSSKSDTPVKEPGRPIASLILGILGLLLWLVPLFGLPATIVGLIFGINALQRQEKGLAVAGVILSVCGLILSIGNAAVGAYLGATGQHQLMNQLMGR